MEVLWCFDSVAGRRGWTAEKGKILKLFGGSRTTVIG